MRVMCRNNCSVNVWVFMSLFNVFNACVGVFNLYKFIVFDNGTIFNLIFINFIVKLIPTFEFVQEYNIKQC